ncbi:DNA-binding transcriptional regulator, AcrR family [Halovenus aranensis]|uniref:DNA-binding transcriptional regulator, AcrR family n=1 Tax=Halovenus aranensis TaxID=890420 RepID=A0A1G8UZU5_9EURY|nr:TetR/AcrR family transcriptional regulator [Halovenus aranensis]SDJ58460.1 DNA-binding transcriptional regulator, AcrR family [Halovenus aranensis]
MSEEEPLGADDIMDAVYQALRDNGYAELTMQDIADECDKSTSLLHYHYDTKEDLLVAFLDQMLADYEEKMECRADQPPVDRLVEFVARFVFAPDDTERASFHLALLEMRSQGPFNDRIRTSLRRSDELLRDTLEETLEDGIDDGVLKPVDTEATAALFVAMLDGARTRQVTLNEGGDDEVGYTRTVAEQALERLVDPLLEDGVDRPSLDDALESIHD